MAKNNNGLKKVMVSELPANFLNAIPSEYHDKEVFIVDINNTKNASIEIFDILNFRFVCISQIGLDLQETTNRQIWYNMETKLKRKGLVIDYTGNSEAQYRTCLKTIKNFCEKLQDYFNVEYWGLVMDELKVQSKGRAIIYDINMNSTILDITCLIDFKISDKPFNDEFINTPFFLLICEKEDTLKSMMSELKARGYNCGFYGIITQGYSSTSTIRLLMKFTSVSNFHVFVVHDFDIDGLKIFFDIKKTFNNAESSGINQEMLDFAGVKFDEINQDYKSGKAKQVQITGAETMIKSLSVDKKTQEKYNSWVKITIPKRAELDSLLALAQDKDLFANKTRWLVDYLELKLKNKKFNLNRYKKVSYSKTDVYKPSVSKPDFIETIIDEIKEKAVEKINEYLTSMDLGYSSDWQNLIESDIEYMQKAFNQLQKAYNWKGRNQAMLYKRNNRNYVDSLTGVKSIIRSQSNDLYSTERDIQSKLQNIRTKMEKILERKLKRTSEYSEVQETLENLKDDIISALENL